MAHTVENLIIEIADKYTLNHNSENYLHNKKMLKEFYARLNEIHKKADEKS